MDVESNFIPVLLVATVALAPVTARAQDSGASHQIQDQIRVRVDVRGVDSTQWFAADIRHTAEGCELIQLRDVAWENGQARLGSDVPMDDRAIVRPRRVREIQTRATDGAEWRLIDVVWFRNRGGPTC